MATTPSSAVGFTPAFLIRVPSPIGRLEITSDGESITSLSIERNGRVPFEEFAENSTEVLERAAVQLGEYFAGTRRDFDLPVLAHGTVFQQSVWAGLGQLAWGEVTSYGQLGLSTGRPYVGRSTAGRSTAGRSTAGRAVGGAVGANPVPIIVPCHRVLASNNRITGYSGGEGIPTKVWLLEHEGIPYKL